MEQSKQYSLNLRDYLNGLLLAVGGAVWGLIMPIINDWIDNKPVAINYADIWHMAVGTAALYLFKNFFSKPSTTTVPSK